MTARRSLAVLVAALVLVACGGSGDGAPAGSASCELPAQQDWLRSYMRDWYYWSGLSPDPAPEGYDTLADYFQALKYTGYGSGVVEPWSHVQDSASYQRFYGEGRTLGYGLFVNGIEQALPLKVRMTEPLSPAAAAGLQRGDVIVSINGRSAADIVADFDFAALEPAQEGEQLSLVTERGGVPATTVLSAAVYALTPVPATRLIDLGDGRQAGYLALKDFITQAEAPLAAALADFRSAGASELIVDLRYNGGGRISTAARLASLIAGAAKAGETFVALRYNAAHRSSDLRYEFAAASGPTFGRVLVLTGPRTCSASELIVNGLAPHLEVVTLGATSCGKPYGFNPVASCGNTFSVVNFRAVNADGAGDYDAGLAPTCPVAEDFSGTPGEPDERLTGAALEVLRTGACPAADAAKGPAALRPLPVHRRSEPGERRGMIAD